MSNDYSANETSATEYRALQAKVDAFCEATATRRQADLSCRKGCDGCCHVWLSVSPVEAEAVRTALTALPAAQRAEIAERGRREGAREADGRGSPRCAMLSDDGQCAVYAQRPLVCRTQGHALRYPPGFVPAGAVRARTSGAASSSAGEITYCPLNYTEQAPGAADVLDAERVDQLLAIVNHRFALARGVSAEQRTSISELAQGADMLGCPESRG
ncbi:MAG: YkgJ family cysteine cluster protein [Myxococcales bacterium]